MVLDESWRQPRGKSGPADMALGSPGASDNILGHSCRREILLFPLGRKPQALIWVAARNTHGKEAHISYCSTSQQLTGVGQGGQVEML